MNIGQQDILHKLISKFDQKTFKDVNLHLVFCLIFERFLQITFQKD